MTHCIDPSLSLWEHTGTKCDLWKTGCILCSHSQRDTGPILGAGRHSSKWQALVAGVGTDSSYPHFQAQSREQTGNRTRLFIVKVYPWYCAPSRKAAPPKLPHLHQLSSKYTYSKACGGHFSSESPRPLLLICFNSTPPQNSNNLFVFLCHHKALQSIVPIVLLS